MHWVQQGDVLIQPAVIPSGQRIPAGQILARGEVTGHTHRLTDTSDGLLIEVDGQLYLSVGPGGACVEHEEHASVDMGPGEYRIGQVQEYDHFAEEARRVKD